MTANPLTPIPPIGPTTGMTPAPTGGRFKPVDPVRVLRRWMRVLIVMTAVGVVLGIAAWFVLQRVAPEYTSFAQLRVLDTPKDIYSPGANSEAFFGTNRDMLEAFIQNEVLYIKSDEILREAINRPLIRNNTEWFAQFNGDVREAQKTLDEDVLGASMMRGTTLISLSAKTPVEDDAPRILQSIIDVYMQRLRQESDRSGASARATVVRERDQTDERVRQLNEQIRQYALQQDINVQDLARSTLSQEQAFLSKQQSELRFALDGAEESYQALIAKQQSGEIEPTPEDIAMAEADPVIQQQRSELNMWERSYRASARRYGENHLETRRLAAELEEHRMILEQGIEDKLRELAAVQIEQASRYVDQLQGQIAAMAPQIQEISARLTDLNTRLNAYQQLIDERETAKLRLAELDTGITRLRILEERSDRIRVQVGATPPELTFPKPQVIVPGVTLLVLAMTLGMIFLREMLDQSVRSPEDVKLLANTELLGVLPDAAEDPSGERDVSRVVEKNPTGLLAEQYRQLRTAILAKMDRRGYKTLMLVGAQPGCGTTTTIQNLAASLALNGRKVVLVDANFRRPGQCHLAGIDADRGMVDVLRGGTTVDQVLRPMPDMSLSILPAGNTENAPPELLEGAGIRNLLAELESKFDAVLIDTSPALLASESQLLAKHVDAIATIVRTDTDKRGMIDRMLRKLDGQRADLLGIILNGVRSSAGGYFRKNYREFYSYRNGSAANGNGNGAGKRSRAAAAESLEQAASDQP